MFTETLGVTGELIHERVVMQQGPRSGLPIIVAVHSTALGQAIGGCRLAHYLDWRDGLTDALRLSSAMSDKCALAGLPNGGGKTVVALPPGRVLDAAARRSLLHDVGDVITAFDGAYATGPDVGTGPGDMVTIAERTPYAFCRPVRAGGSGDSSQHTAVGVLAALHAVCTQRFGSSGLSARSFAVLGLGRVGGHVVRMLAEAGATLVVSDIDNGKRALADRYGATWTSPQNCLTAEVDVLVPAALGGLLTAQSVPTLRCAAIAGPANNQLAAPATADLLHERGILWAPTLSLLGLVRHLADVERRWFRQVLAGQDAPPRFSSETDPDGDFDGAVSNPAVIAAAWQAWRDEVTFADQFVTHAQDLDIEGRDTWRGTVSARWVLIHMIEEYARHNGHADLLRERIDGTIGM